MAVKTEAQFVAECEALKDERGIEIVEKQLFRGFSFKYNWRCVHDGNVWDATIKTVQTGRGCTICGQRKQPDRTVPLEHFLEKLDERNETSTPVSYVSGYNGLSWRLCLFKCDICDREWTHKPSAILAGSGCPACHKRQGKSGYTYSLDDVKHLIEQRNLKLPHKRVYLVDATFEMYSKKVTLTCDHGHSWEARLNDTINREAGCPHCAGSVSRDSITAIEHIKAIHPNIKIVGKLGQTLGRREPFEAGCEHGHTWMATYERLVNGHYCPHCANRAKYTQEQFQSIVAETGSHVRVLGQYNGMNKQIEMQCTDCDHIWYTTSQQIASGGGCPMCAKNNTYSKKSIDWLTQIEKEQGIKIDHAVSGGEFRIPGTRYRVDGYHKESNTVYEFHGNYWHGNPKLHNPDDINTITECTFGELYQKTLKKEAEIRALGYNLVVMWEDEFDQQMSVANQSLTAV